MRKFVLLLLLIPLLVHCSKEVVETKPVTNEPVDNIKPGDCLLVKSHGYLTCTYFRNVSGQLIRTNYANHYDDQTTHWYIKYLYNDSQIIRTERWFPRYKNYPDTSSHLDTMTYVLEVKINGNSIITMDYDYDGDAQVTKTYEILPDGKYKKLSIDYQDKGSSFSYYYLYTYHGDTAITSSKYYSSLEETTTWYLDDKNAPMLYDMSSPYKVIHEFAPVYQISDWESFPLNTKHNVKGYVFDNSIGHEKVTFDLKYNDKGYPTKVTTTSTDGNVFDVATYEYDIY